MTSNNNGIPRKVLFAGIDDGFAETKVCLSNGVNIKIKSQAKAGEMNQISINGGPATVYSYSTADGPFIIGDLRESDPTASDEYPVSAMNRVIVSHALRLAGVTSEYDVYICTGLPVKKFYVGGKPNQKLIAAKQQNLLLNDVASSDEGDYRLCRIKRHDVLAEGVAAWMDLVLYRNQDGNIVKNKQLSAQRIAIIDIGGRTTDIAVIQEGIMDNQRSSTIEVGMLAVRDAISAAINSAHGVEPTSEMLNDALSTRTIKLWGTATNVDDLVEKAIISTVTRIKAEVKKLLQNAVDIDRVVFVGGTVVEIEKHLDGWFRNQSICPSPPFANAQGMLKFAESKMLKN